MAEIDNLIQVNITANTATPTQGNFGTPAILAYHTHNTDLIRTYNDLAGMVSDGFTTTEAAYLAATAIVSQNPRPPQFKIIRQTTAVVQVMQFTVTDSTNGHVVGLTMTSPAGVSYTISNTNSSQSTTDIALALDTAANGGAIAVFINSGASGPVWTMTTIASGTTWFVSNITGGTFKDTTTTYAPATDLTAATLVDPAWYCLIPTQLGATNIQAAAVWIEANNRIMSYISADTENLTSGTGIFHTLKVANYNRSIGFFTFTPAQFSGAAIAGQRLTADPGSDTWAYKTLNGVTADVLTATQNANILTNGGNWYMAVDGVNITYNGAAASGLFIDITRGIDALANDIQVSVYDLLLSNPKVPFTRKGIFSVRGKVAASLQRATSTGFLSGESGFEYLVTVPDLKAVNPVDKKNRLLKGLNFVAYATGAIQTIQINGAVNL